MGETECILTDAGYEIIKNKYSNEIAELLEDINRKHKEDEAREKAFTQEYISHTYENTDMLKISGDEGLPF